MGGKAQRRLCARHGLGVDVARRDVVADEEFRPEPSALLVVRGVDHVGGRLARMNRHRQAAFHRRGHVLMVGALLALRQPAQIDPEGEEPVEGGAAGEIIALDPIDIGEVERLVTRHLVDMPIGVAGAQHRVPVRPQLGIGVRGGARVVRPVVYGGDAGIGELHQPQHHAVVEVVRAVELRSRILGRKIAEAAIADEVSAECAPHVIVRVDETRHHDHVGRVDHLGVRCGQIRSDPGDPAVADEYIGARQGAQRLVDGHHRAILDEVGSARPRRSGALRDGPCGKAKRHAATQRGRPHELRQRSASQHDRLRPGLLALNLAAEMRREQGAAANMLPRAARRFRTPVAPGPANSAHATASCRSFH